MQLDNQATPPTIKGWIQKATVDGLDPTQMQALMAEALATPAKVPYGNPPATVPEREGEALAQVMALRTPPHVTTADDALLETRPVRDNTAEQEAARRSAGAGGGIVPPPTRKPQ